MPGGDGNLHALNAANGNVIWSTPIENIGIGEYIWGSPVVFNGTIYLGIASFDDCKQIVGKVVSVALSNGGIQHTFATGDNGCNGGGIWSTPTVDPATGDVYVATGNPATTIPGGCSTKYMQAVIALSPTLQVLSYWTLPTNQATVDSDFGSTPTLFTANNLQMVGVVNKNGRYYAFDRNNIGNGPLWYVQVADGGYDPQGGEGSIAPSAFDGSQLYLAGGKSGGCAGTLRAVDPATGNQVWMKCLNTTVLGAVTATSNAVFIAYGSQIAEYNASNGDQMFAYTDNAQNTTFYSAVTVVPGAIVVGDTSGTLFCFSW